MRVTHSPGCTMVLLGTFLLGSGGAAAQTAPAPATAPAEEDPATTEAFSPFRDWWYRGARRPDGGSAEIRRLLAFRDTHPDDPEAIAWIHQLQRYRSVPQIPHLPDLIRAAADKGGPMAMVALAELLLKGEDVPADRERAMALLRTALDKGEPDAALLAGWAHMTGPAGVQTDLDAAEKYLKRALEMGTIRAHYMLGLLYERRGNERAAAAAFRRGAEEGDERAMEAMAKYHNMGLGGVDRDPLKVMLYLQRAAERGSPLAQSQYARGLWTGHGGLRHDDALARKLLENALTADDPLAMLMIAQASLTGAHEFPRDPARSVQLLEKLAERNYPEGMFELARLRVEGVHVPRDLDAARTLLEQSAAKGYAPAEELRKRLESAPVPAL